MKIITLDPIPNQSLSVVLDNVLWEIKAVTCKGSLAVSIKRNNQTLVDGARAVAGELIIQPSYLSAFGNFAMITDNNELVDYQKFGNSQFLAFVTAADF